MKYHAIFYVMLPLLFSGHALSCLENQIYVQEHQVAPYVRADQTPVSGYQRNGYCRDINTENYFRDSSTQKIKGSHFKLKKWSDAEKKIVQSHIDKLPKWLGRYRFGEVLRAENDGTKNPAATVPYTKTIIFFDPFFSSKNQKDILIHEVAHLAVWDLEVSAAEAFAAASGWYIDETKTKRLPPTNPISTDSVNSISEDFANHIEIYYANEAILRKQNPKAHDFIRKLVLRKENP